MIYTVTFNPSLDYIIRVDDFTTGTINKTTFEKLLPGGKGINVSVVLTNLGHESTALGFVAGFTGLEIEARLKRFGCGIDFIKAKDGLSRINVKMKSQEETEINGQGPQISEEELEALFARLDTIRNEDMLVISGSIPASLPDDMYERIMKRMQSKNTRVIVDAAGTLMMKVLKYRPFLIKPNHHELGDLFGVKLTTPQEVIPYARKLQELGARNVLVSMAKAGAILLDEEGKTHVSPAPRGTAVNSVGAGDSMVAGFLSGYLESKGNYAYALQKGIAAGSASAFSEDLATASEVSALLSRMNASRSA